jgi:RNA polymerase sigma-70 factor (ECF subfamily)
VRWTGWLARYRGGDRAAYRDLLVELGDVIEAYLRRHFGAGEFLEDCTQECLLAIHRSLATYDPARSFRPWMFTIVRHKAIDVLRRRGTRTRHEVSESAGLMEGSHAYSPPLAEHAVQAAQILSALEPEHRDALVLTKLQGYSLAEAAERAGISASAMKSRVHRALKGARRLLEDEDA